MHWLKVGLAVAVLFVVTGIGVFYQSGTWPTHSFLGPGMDWESLVRTIVLALAMLIGIGFGVMYKAPTAHDPAVAPAYLTGIFRPMLASPLVFMFVYTTARDIPDMIVAGLLAFENGFFCESILNRRPELKG